MRSESDIAKCRILKTHSCDHWYRVSAGKCARLPHPLLIITAIISSGLSFVRQNSPSYHQPKIFKHHFLRDPYGGRNSVKLYRMHIVPTRSLELELNNYTKYVDLEAPFELKTPVRRILYPRRFRY